MATRACAHPASLATRGRATRLRGASLGRVLQECIDLGLVRVGIAEDGDAGLFLTPSGEALASEADQPEAP